MVDPKKVVSWQGLHLDAIINNVNDNVVKRNGIRNVKIEKARVQMFVSISVGND
jgi:hypothetical protein